jgi:hypothetical protein
VARLARALQVFLNRGGTFLPGMVEPVLIASNPAVHVDTVRPIVRVVMSDGIKQFAGSLLQTRPILKPEQIPDLVDHIINPRPRRATQPGDLLQSVPGAAAPADEPKEESGEAPQRARAIFQAAEESKPFDPADLSFEFNENASTDVPAGLRETSPSHKLGAGTAAAASSARARRAALRPGQLVVLAIMLLVECGIIGWLAYLVVSSRL